MKKETKQIGFFLTKTDDNTVNVKEIVRQKDKKGNKQKFSKVSLRLVNVEYLGKLQNIQSEILRKSSPSNISFRNSIIAATKLLMK
jgi:hypothetical protein